MKCRQCLFWANKKCCDARSPKRGITTGAGDGCDGQVLVTHDILGLYKKFTPKFAKRYADISAQIKEAVEKYKQEVEAKKFPAKEHSFSMDEKELRKLKIKS